jgi:hypothetical protein
MRGAIEDVRDHYTAGRGVRPMSALTPRRKVATSLRRIPVTLLSCSHGMLTAHAWNGSWNVAPDNPSVASAVSTVVRFIGVARAYAARGRTTCKRLVDAETA